VPYFIGRPCKFDKEVVYDGCKVDATQNNWQKHKSVENKKVRFQQIKQEQIQINSLFIVVPDLIQPLHLKKNPSIFSRKSIHIFLQPRPYSYSYSFLQNSTPLKLKPKNSTKNSPQSTCRSPNHRPLTTQK